MGRDLTTSLTSAWNVVVGGEPAGGTRPRHAPAVTESLAEGRRSLESGLGRLRRRIAHLFTTSLGIVLWFSLGAWLATLIYLPEADRRREVWGRARRTLDTVRRSVG